MKTLKYIKVDQEKVKKDFYEVYERYEGTHMVQPVAGVKIDLRKLAPNESVIYGDGHSFHFKLTKL